jgi:hypothetical protein
MSQHAIEDLVETTIYLIDRSALDPARQAALIHGLLDLQARYDTSLTWFRMTEVLLRQGVLLRTRLDALADATLRARADAADWPGWIEHEGDPLYLEWEDDARVLYRQTAPETALPLPVLLHDVLALADQADDGALFADWYALLVNGWLEDVFGAEDGIAISLEGLLASDTLQAIRTLAARRGLERRRGVPEALTLPRLADAGDRDDVERSAGLRFFLEPKRRPSALRAARDKALAQQARVRELIPALVAQRLDGPLLRLGWMSVTAAPAPRRHWIRERDGDHHAPSASWTAACSPARTSARSAAGCWTQPATTRTCAPRSTAWRPPCPRSTRTTSALSPGSSRTPFSRATSTLCCICWKKATTPAPSHRRCCSTAPTACCWPSSSTDWRRAMRPAQQAWSSACAHATSRSPASTRGSAATWRRSCNSGTRASATCRCRRCCIRYWPATSARRKPTERRGGHLRALCWSDSAVDRRAAREYGRRQPRCCFLKTSL